VKKFPGAKEVLLANVCLDKKVDGREALLNYGYM
jgi:hypothetical protein